MSLAIDISTRRMPNAILRIDDEDWEWAKRFKWTPRRATTGDCVYAIHRMPKNDKHEARTTNALLHREIMQARFFELVDHTDGDGLNNVRSNLRKCSIPQNLWNVARRRSNTGLIGVHKCQSGRFVAYISVDGVRLRLGYYDTAEQAAMVRDAKALEFHGEFANLNFPETVRP